MKITTRQVIVCSPGRNFVTLKLETEDGVYGLGDATLNGRELAVASYLTDHVIPLLDRSRCAPHRGHLAVPLQGRVLAARAGHDGARLRRSIPRSGTSRARRSNRRSISCSAARRVTRCWSTATRAARSIDETVAAVGRATVERGYTAIRAQCARAGRDEDLRHRPRGRRTNRPNAARSSRAMWSSARYLRLVPPLFERLRREFGPDVHLLHDVHHRLTPIEAARLGKALEPYHLFWLEDPTPAENQEASG